jgi:hypothetical protein
VILEELRRGGLKPSVNEKNAQAGMHPHPTFSVSAVV